MEAELILLILFAALLVAIATKLKRGWQRILGFIPGFALILLVTYVYGSFISRGLPREEVDMDIGVYEVLDVNLGAINGLVLLKNKDGEIRVYSLKSNPPYNERYLNVTKYAGEVIISYL